MPTVYTACVSVTVINYRFMGRIYLRCESKLVSSDSKLVFIKCNNILLPLQLSEVDVKSKLSEVYHFFSLEISYLYW